MNFFNDFITAIDTRFSRMETMSSAEMIVKGTFYKYYKTPQLMDAMMFYTLCEIVSVDHIDEMSLQALLTRDIREWSAFKHLSAEQVAFDNLLEWLLDLAESTKIRGKEETLGDHIKWLTFNWWKIEEAPGEHRARLFEICEYHGFDAEYCYNTIQKLEECA